MSRLALLLLGWLVVGLADLWSLRLSWYLLVDRVLPPGEDGLMLVSPLWLSGIPATEHRALVTRGEDYRRYQRTTSAFFPWSPRKSPVP